MAKRSAKRTTRIISPHFFIPDGVDELAYDEKSSAAAGLDAADDFWLSDNNEVYSDEVITPDILGIIDQTIRTAPGGAQVVDVLFDVEDVAGATNYEFRLVTL